MSTDFKLYRCVQCGFEYDEAEGWPEDGIEPGTRWDDIPEDWSCPRLRGRQGGLRHGRGQPGVSAMSNHSTELSTVVIVGSGIAGGERRADAPVGRLQRTRRPDRRRTRTALSASDGVERLPVGCHGGGEDRTEAGLFLEGKRYRIDYRCNGSRTRHQAEVGDALLRRDPVIQCSAARDRRPGPKTRGCLRCALLHSAVDGRRRFPSRVDSTHRVPARDRRGVSSDVRSRPRRGRSARRSPSSNATGRSSVELCPRTSRR